MAVHVKPSPTLAIIGRGCDPVRARFAEQHFAARLGVRVDCATSDEVREEVLLTALGSGFRERRHGS